MKRIDPQQGEDPLAILKRCDGYYDRPPGGPLVGYAGRDDQGRQYVGMVYANFAKSERHGDVLNHIANTMIESFPSIEPVGAGFCGAPEGGKALAVALATRLGKDYIFPEKQVTALKTETSREKSILVWGRHEPEPGEEWWIVEDVCNNFSTTIELIKLIESRGARVVGVLCFLNRSLTVDKEYSPEPGRVIPIKALVRKPIAEYKQDDPEVADDIKKGNVVLKPKNEWGRLPK
jgi:orotate phosphoribosyltransferase